MMRPNSRPCRTGDLADEASSDYRTEYACNSIRHWRTSFSEPNFAEDEHFETSVGYDRFIRPVAILRVKKCDFISAHASFWQEQPGKANTTLRLAADWLKMSTTNEQLKPTLNLRTVI